MLLFLRMAVASPCHLSTCCLPMNMKTVVLTTIKFRLSIPPASLLHQSCFVKNIALAQTPASTLSVKEADSLGGACKKESAVTVPAELPQAHGKQSAQEMGAFQQLPMVACSIEILGSALRKARNVHPTKGIANIAKRERNRGAKQLDALTKELALPLRTYVKSFPQKHRLHLYEYALIDLTFGTGKYEEVLFNVNLLRKKILDVGKNCASLCARSISKRQAEELLKEGLSKLEECFQKHGGVVDELMAVAKTLRAMPVVSVKVPTLCLVGAPNVGKSSLVRILSTGKPEVCNYPFTTRGISMGHIFVHTDVYQVTDTPGLLLRPDEERNSMEKLTLAALSYLPTAVLFVHDLSGNCGVQVSDQLKLYKEIKDRFPDRPWLDVVSKADLLLQPSSMDDAIPSDADEAYKFFGPEGAMRVSIQTGEGVNELRQRVLSLLSEHCWEEPLNTHANIELSS